MTVENISWSIFTKECCRPRRGLNPRPPGLQSDGASNWATEAGCTQWWRAYLNNKSKKLRWLIFHNTILGRFLSCKSMTRDGVERRVSNLTRHARDFIFTDFRHCLCCLKLPGQSGKLKYWFIYQWPIMIFIDWETHLTFFFFRHGPSSRYAVVKTVKNIFRDWKWWTR